MRKFCLNWIYLKYISLNQSVKQPYSVCCLTVHLFKGVQWGKWEQHEHDVKKH